MNALPIIIGALCVLAIAYRYYSAFLAAKVLTLDDRAPVPAQTMYDGHNYYPTTKWVLFGHHFAAISGAGPLIGPVLAAQFGFLPGLLWLVIGVCLGGAVHDFMILAASIRRKGKSLAEIARTEISGLSGFVAGVAILFIVVIALAGLGLVVVNALAESPWGTFTVGFTIPLALFMGLYLYRFRQGRIAEATAIGVVGLLLQRDRIRQRLSVRPQLDRLAGHQCMPRANSFRRDGESDREGNRRAHEWVRQHVDGGKCRRGRVDCGDIPISRGLICDQY